MGIKKLCRLDAVLHQFKNCYNFIVLTQEMTAVAAREKGILIDERFWSHDLNTVFLYERYANSEAAISHLQLFWNQFSHRFTQFASRERF